MTVKSLPRLRRWLRRLGWTAAWIFTLLVLATVVENWRGQRAWEAYQAAAQARGDRLDPEAVIPPPVPESDNLASAPIFKPLFDRELNEGNKVHPAWKDFLVGSDDAELNRVAPADIVKQNHGWLEGEAVDLAALQTYYQTLSDFTESAAAPSAGEAVLEALNRFDHTFAALQEACARPRARFPIRYQDSFAAALPHLAVLRRCAKLAMLRSVAELSVGQGAKALTDAEMAISLSESIENEPIILSAMVEAALLDSALQPIWEGLVRHSWNESQLAELDQRLEKFNFVNRCAISIRGERNLFDIPALDALRAKPQFIIPDASKATLWMVRLAPYGWVQQNKVVICRVMDEMLESVNVVDRRFDVERAVQTDRNINRLGKGGRNPYTIAAEAAIPATLRYEKRCAFSQTMIDLARVAVALEHHRLSHLEYPASLEALDAVCKPMGGIPADCVTGRPPQYTREGKGTFTLTYDGWGSGEGAKSMSSEKGAKDLDFEKGPWAWPKPKVKGAGN